MTTTPGSEPVESKHERQERAFELLVSRLLQVGVTVSLLMVVFGTTTSFVHHSGYRNDRAELPQVIGPDAVFPHSIRTVLVGIGEMRGQSIAAAGLLLLIATPVLRVAVSIIAFAWQRDWAYTIITTIVLGLLILSFALGKAEG